MKKSLISAVMAVILLFCSCSFNAPVDETPEPPVSELSEKAMLYFASEDSMYLIPEEREIKYETREELFAGVVNGVIEGPVTENLFPVLNPASKIKGVSVKDGIYEVTLDESFVSLNTGGSTKEFMALYSIVNTLCELEDGSSVRFLNADGTALEEFGSYVTDQPLTKDTSLAE